VDIFYFLVDKKAFIWVTFPTVFLPYPHFPPYPQFAENPVFKRVSGKLTISFFCSVCYTLFCSDEQWIGERIVLLWHA